MRFLQPVGFLHNNGNESEIIDNSGINNTTTGHNHNHNHHQQQQQQQQINGNFNYLNNQNLSTQNYIHNNFPETILTTNAATTQNELLTNKITEIISSPLQTNITTINSTTNDLNSNDFNEINQTNLIVNPINGAVGIVAAANTTTGVAGGITRIIDDDTSNILISSEIVTFTKNKKNRLNFETTQQQQSNLNSASIIQASVDTTTTATATSTSAAITTTTNEHSDDNKNDNDIFLDVVNKKLIPTSSSTYAAGNTTTTIGYQLFENNNSNRKIKITNLNLYNGNNDEEIDGINNFQQTTNKIDNESTAELQQTNWYYREHLNKLDLNTTIISHIPLQENSIDSSPDDCFMDDEDTISSSLSSLASSSAYSSRDNSPQPTISNYRGIINPNYPGFQHLAHTLSEHFFEQQSISEPSTSSSAEDSDLSEFELEATGNNVGLGNSGSSASGDLLNKINTINNNNNNNNNNNINNINNSSGTCWNQNNLDKIENALKNVFVSQHHDYQQQQQQQPQHQPAQEFFLPIDENHFAMDKPTKMNVMTNFDDDDTEFYHQHDSKPDILLKGRNKSIFTTTINNSDDQFNNQMDLLDIINKKIDGLSVVTSSSEKPDILQNVNSRLIEYFDDGRHHQDNADDQFDMLQLKQQQLSPSISPSPPPPPSTTPNMGIEDGDNDDDNDDNDNGGGGIDEDLINDCCKYKSDMTPVAEDIVGNFEQEVEHEIGLIVSGYTTNNSAMATTITTATDAITTKKSSSSIVTVVTAVPPMPVTVIEEILDKPEKDVSANLDAVMSDVEKINQSLEKTIDAILSDGKDLINSANCSNNDDTDETINNIVDENEKLNNDDDNFDNSYNDEENKISPSLIERCRNSTIPTAIVKPKYQRKSYDDRILPPVVCIDREKPWFCNLNNNNNQTIAGNNIITSSTQKTTNNNSINNNTNQYFDNESDNFNDFDDNITQTNNNSTTLIIQQQKKGQKKHFIRSTAATGQHHHHHHHHQQQHPHHHHSHHQLPNSTIKTTKGLIKHSDKEKLSSLCLRGEKDFDCTSVAIVPPRKKETIMAEQQQQQQQQLQQQPSQQYHHYTQHKKPIYSNDTNSMSPSSSSSSMNRRSNNNNDIKRSMMTSSSSLSSSTSTSSPSSSSTSSIHKKNMANIQNNMTKMNKTNNYINNNNNNNNLVEGVVSTLSSSPVLSSSSSTSSSSSSSSSLASSATSSPALATTTTAQHHHHHHHHHGRKVKSSRYGGSSNNTKETLANFDVYNIETALPKIDLDAIESHLKAAKEEERRKRNDRKEILRRLALGTDYETHGSGSNNGHNNNSNRQSSYQDKPSRKPSLHSRLQGGMNLQICFMNETASDTESPSSDSESCPKLSKSQTFSSTGGSSVSGGASGSGVSGVGHNNSGSSSGYSPEYYLRYSNSANSRPLCENLSKGRPASLHLDLSSSLMSGHDTKDIDFFTKQARLQIEARMALAQAKDMAHMQMEMDRQSHKKSPITEIIHGSLEKVGIKFPPEKRRVSRQMLTDMIVPQLQVIVNDLHTHIERLNEDLVQYLMERDELHMSQDSMLVDIEDLTRYLEDKGLQTNYGSANKQEDSSSSSSTLMLPTSPILPPTSDTIRSFGILKKRHVGLSSSAAIPPSVGPSSTLATLGLPSTILHQSRIINLSNLLGKK